MNVDAQKIRRESLRWYILLALDKARPNKLVENIVLSTMQAIYPDTTAQEIRVQLDYLEARKMIELEKTPDNRWFAELNRLGIDLVEYTINCEPGIARPDKYWS